MFLEATTTSIPKITKKLHSSQFLKQIPSKHHNKFDIPLPIGSIHEVLTVNEI